MRTEAYDRDELARTLFEESGDALFLFDPDSGELLDANPTAQRLSGFPLAVLRRLPVSYLFRSEAAHGCSACARRATRAASSTPRKVTCSATSATASGCPST